MARQERQTMIRALEARRSTRLICYLTSDRGNASAQVNKDVLPLLYEHLLTIGRQPCIDVLVHTTGGDVLAGFGIIKMLREFTDTIRLLVPFKCHSAGTLMALGAKTIAMTPGATLSPIDPSVNSLLGPVVETAPGQRQVLPLSVESVAGFLGLVEDDWKLQGEDAKITAFKILAEKVHPLALGDVYRARKQIEQLAAELFDHRHDKEQIEAITKKLSRGLGSHDYAISRSETRRMLGAQIEPDDVETEKAIWDLYQDFAAEMELRSPYDPLVTLQANNNEPLSVVQRLAYVESTAHSDVAERELKLSPAQPTMPTIHMVPGMVVPHIQQQAGRVVHQEVVRAGWKRYE